MRLHFVLSAIIIGIVVSLAGLASFRYLSSREAVKSPLPDLPEVRLPEVDVGVAKDLPLRDGKADSGAELFQAKALNVSLLPLYGKEPVGTVSAQVVAARLMGEAQNIGTKTIYNLKPLIKLFDKEDNLITTKTALFTPGFDFFPLDSGEIGLFDFFLNEPLTAEKLSIAFSSVDNADDADDTRMTPIIPLTIEEIDYVTKEQEGTRYVEVIGKVKNESETDLTRLRVYAYVKRKKLQNEEESKSGKVIGWGKQEFSQDILAIGQKKDFKFNVILLLAGELEEIKYLAGGVEY